VSLFESIFWRFEFDIVCCFCRLWMFVTFKIIFYFYSCYTFTPSVIIGLCFAPWFVVHTPLLSLVHKSRHFYLLTRAIYHMLDIKIPIPPYPLSLFGNTRREPRTNGNTGCLYKINTSVPHTTMSSTDIDSAQNRLKLTNLCIEQLKKIIEETEKVSEQEIYKSIWGVSEALTNFKSEVDKLRVQVIYNYSPGKYG